MGKNFARVTGATISAAPLGGPIIIPKLYNGKDKTFFYWAYEQFGYNQLFYIQRYGADPCVL